MARIYVTEKDEITVSENNLVTLKTEGGEVFEKLEPRRLFPFTNQNMYITLLNKEEKEVGFVRDVEELDKASREALEECFREYYMVPKILHLLESEDKFGSLKWKVETDRGVVTFRIRNRHSDIKQLHGTKRVIIRDSNDNRYEIPDYTALDPHSSRLLFSYL